MQLLNKQETRALLELLASHDWYFEMSDDMRIWRKGFAEQTLIKQQMSQLDPWLAKFLLNSYAPKEIDKVVYGF